MIDRRRRILTFSVHEFASAKWSRINNPAKGQPSEVFTVQTLVTGRMFVMVMAADRVVDRTMGGDATSSTKEASTLHHPHAMPTNRYNREADFDSGTAC